MGHMMGILDRYYDPPMNGGDDINLPFIIGLSSSLSFILLIILILAVYYIFFNDSLQSQEFQTNNLHIPDSFSSMDDLFENESLYLDKLSSDDLFYYKMTKKFQNQNKPSLRAMGQGIDLNVELLIRNRGIHCFYFDSYVDQLSDLMSNEDTETTPLINNQLAPTSYGSLVRNDIPFVIEDKTDISFLSSAPSSATLNLPLPTKNRHNDTIYFEVKLFEFDIATTKLGLGLSTKPCPNFRLPGEFYYSFGLETTGHLKINKPLLTDEEETPVLTPQLLQGDVIGIGFRSATGTIFITHNGKKIADVIRNLKTDLYPCIGSVGGPSKVQVNLGQSGFVFIEANVKKLGFCESNNEGNLGAPPMYDKVIKKEHKNNNSNSSSSDIILERGEILPPHYPEEEETFFGPRALLKRNNNDNVEHCKPELPSKPPSYRSETPSSNSDSSEKIVKLLSTKVKRQKQIPDKLLDLNERYYEHSTSQFDQNENLGGETGIDISEQNLQDLLIEEEEDDDNDNNSSLEKKGPSSAGTPIADDEASSSSQAFQKKPSPAPTAGSAVSSSSRDHHLQTKSKKKKKKSSKKNKKNKRNW